MHVAVAVNGNAGDTFFSRVPHAFVSGRGDVLHFSDSDRLELADAVANEEDDNEHQQGNGNIIEESLGHMILSFSQQVDSIVDIQQDRQQGIATHEWHGGPPHGAPNTISKQLFVGEEYQYRSEYHD